MIPRVGRIYFEGASGYVAQAMYAQHERLREPEIRWDGRVWRQVRRLPDGPWVYRAERETRALGMVSTAGLEDVCGVGEAAWVWPSDAVEPVEPRVVARAAVEEAVRVLAGHDAGLAAQLTAVLGG